ncbi:MAG: DUF5336 domain-containing protein [Pseudonocardiaceae bacterium]
MSLPYGQPPPAQQQPGPSNSPSGGLGLSKILAIVPGGLGLVLYFLSFTDGAGGYLRDLVGVLLLGGGLLAAASVLPKAPATLLPGTVAALTGALFLLVSVAKGPPFVDLPGDVGGTPALAVVAVILALLEAAACVAAVLLDAGLVKMALTPRPSRFPQRSWGPAPGAPPQGAYPGAYPGSAGPPGGQAPGGQAPGGWPGAGVYPGFTGGYPGGPGGYPGAGSGYPGGYPAGPGPGGYLSQPPVAAPSGGSTPAQPQPDLSQTVEYRGGLQDPYAGQHGQSAHQPGPYGAEPGSYSSEPSPYRSEPGKFGNEPGKYGSDPAQHSAEPGRHAGEPGQDGDEGTQADRSHERPNSPPDGFGTPGKS